MTQQSSRLNRLLTLLDSLAASLIRVPTEVVKQRMQTGQFASAPMLFDLLLRKKDIKGFMQIEDEV